MIQSRIRCGLQRTTLYDEVNSGRQLDEVEICTVGLAGLAAIQTGFLLFRGPAEQGQHYFISLRNAITKTEKVSLVN